VLEVSLRKAGFSVTPAASVQDALDKLDLHAPDLIISETTFPDGDGFELRRRVRASPDWAEIPFIFLTAEAAIENKIRGLELGVDDYLTKPIYIKEIVTRINILLQKRQRVRFEERRDGRTRFAGRVADMPVVDVIQTIEISRKSGVIQFVAERNRQAAIYFREGRVIDAEAGALQGEDAVYRLLTWSEGDFEVVFRTVRRREVIATSSQGLLMEGMRRLDEWSRLLEQLPPLTHRFEVDAGELAARLGDVPDDNNAILRLIDGKRTLLEVIDSSDVGDLECLQAISRLYFEEMLIDLDHGAQVRHPTGRPAPLVEVTPGLDDHAREATPIEGAARDSAEHDVPMVPDSGPSAIAIESQPAEPAARGSGPIELRDTDRIDDQPEIVEDGEDPPQTSNGELMGTLRPSSLFLIDEAVAAAQAIEPDLFKDDVPQPEIKPSTPLSKVLDTAVPEFERDAPTPRLAPDHVIQLRGSDPMIFEISEVEAIEDANVELVMDRVPKPIRKEHSPPRRITNADAKPLGREESGLRMIGSLGRDRAETSGEVSLPRSGSSRANTERELVTILPRRITREMQVVAPPADTPEAAEANVEAQATPIEVPKRLPPPPMFSTAGGVVRRPTGPGKGAMALLALAGVLAVVAIYLYVTRPTKRAKKPPADASEMVVTPIDAGSPADTAGFEPTPDAAVAIADAKVARADAAVGVADAAVAARDAAPVDAPTVIVEVESREAQAKQLYEQAFNALEESNYEKALQLVDQSLKLRGTARSHVLRAQALQRLGRVDEALTALDAAEQAYPSPAIYEARARIYKAAGRRDDARTAIEKYLSMVPDRGNTVKLFKQWLEELR
jgi:CheY-like chemotaxis protein/Flp pilus assembly protein TadD